MIFAKIFKKMKKIILRFTLKNVIFKQEFKIKKILQLLFIYILKILIFVKIFEKIKKKYYTQIYNFFFENVIFKQELKI